MEEEQGTLGPVVSWEYACAELEEGVVVVVVGVAHDAIRSEESENSMERETNVAHTDLVGES